MATAHLSGDGLRATVVSLRTCWLDEWALQGRTCSSSSVAARPTSGRKTRRDVKLRGKAIVVLVTMPMVTLNALQAAVASARSSAKTGFSL